MDEKDRVLVVFSRGTWTHPVATALAEILARDGFHVEIADADTRAIPPPCDYEAVVLGSPARLGRAARPVVTYAANYRDELSAMPAFWYAVGHGDADPDRMRRATGWRPKRSFAVALPRWSERWFGDPRAPPVRELADAIVDELPAYELAT
jgi:menaquinone-dependent protoporphyrinogen IX oxidase